MQHFVLPDLSLLATFGPTGVRGGASGPSFNDLPPEVISLIARHLAPHKGGENAASSQLYGAVKHQLSSLDFAVESLIKSLSEQHVHLSRVAPTANMRPLVLRGSPTQRVLHLDDETDTLCLSFTVHVSALTRWDALCSAAARSTEQLPLGVLSVVFDMRFEDGLQRTMHENDQRQWFQWLHQEHKQNVPCIRTTINVCCGEPADGLLPDTGLDLRHVPGLLAVGDNAFADLAVRVTFGTHPFLQRIGTRAFAAAQTLDFGQCDRLRVFDDQAVFSALRVTRLETLAALRRIGTESFFLAFSAETGLCADLSTMKQLEEIGDGAFRHAPECKFGNHPNLRAIGASAFASLKKQTTVSANSECTKAHGNDNLVLVHA